MHPQTQNKMEICSLMRPLPDDSYNREILLDLVPMGQFDVWVYFIGCGLALVLEVAMMTLFFCLRKLRESPGDIFFGSLVFEFLTATAWLISSVIQFQWGPIQSEQLSCQFQAGLSISGHTGQILYVTAFFYFMRQQIKSSFKPNTGRTWKLHVTIALITLITVTIFFSFSLTGKEMDGQCSLQIFKMPDYVIIIGYTMMLLFYIGVGTYSIVYIRKNVPQHYKEKARRFVRFSILYFTAYVLLTFFTYSMQLLGSFGCQNLWNVNLDVIYGFTSFFDVLTIITFPIIRVQDPYTNRVLRKVFKLQGQQKSLVERESMDLEGSDVVEEIEMQRTGLDDGLRPKSQTEDNNFMNLMQSNKRTQIMAKIIGGLQIVQHQKYHTLRIETLNFKFDNIFDEKKVLNFKANELITEVPGVPPNQYSEILEQNTQMKLIVYTPIIFHALMNREKEKIDIISALNLGENLEKIRSIGKNDGGKSGQFFFYSMDNQVIIKTITQQELRVFLTVLKQYFTYLISNPDSIIAKIYGLYSIEQQNEKSIHLILMRNIARTTQTYRIYDLKGSSFDREVAKKDIDLQKVVLKDLDFLKIEQFLCVSEEDAKYIYQNANRDSQFFRAQGLIDYSLIVFKIINEKNQAQGYKWNVFQSEDQRYRYHLGIIDYFQEYTVQKKMEKYSKRFIKMNQNLDTSSQDPVIYQERFSNFVKKIVKLD